MVEQISQEHEDGVESRWNRRLSEAYRAIDKLTDEEDDETKVEYQLKLSLLHQKMWQLQARKLGGLRRYADAATAEKVAVEWGKQASRWTQSIEMDMLRQADKERGRQDDNDRALVAL